MGLRGMHRADVQGMVKDVADLVRKPRNMDVDQFALARMTEDHKEGVEAFLGRRKPRFRGK